jgi:hypothetical protein
MLEHQKDKMWHDIVTLNESWFYFTTDYERIWPPEGTEALGRDRIIIHQKNDGGNCPESYMVPPDCHTSRGNEI